MMRPLLSWTFGRRRYPTPQEDALILAQLREAALRAIWRLEQGADGPGDINPHTGRTSSYALASMLTLYPAGDAPAAVSDTLGRVAHMVFAGKPQHREARRDWTVWELERLGHTAAAERFTDLVATRGGTLARPRTEGN
ncbi:hypothetical protein ACPCK9_26495 [Streptomyces koyangensis]|uniref:hypothetical protein n=1 Tax=Streptomyces koyangensis TaxID=188770 RepID=UPI003C2C642E